MSDNSKLIIRLAIGAILLLFFILGAYVITDITHGILSLQR